MKSLNEFLNNNKTIFNEKFFETLQIQEPQIVEFITYKESTINLMIKNLLTFLETKEEIKTYYITNKLVEISSKRKTYYSIDLK